MLPKLSDAIIRQSASPQSIERGEDYYMSGSVIETVRRDKTLYAQVEGSEYEPYRVTIELDEGGIRQTACTCLYNYGGFCKHIVAVLLTYIRKPTVFDERPAFDELLNTLSLEQARNLLKLVLEHHPELTDWFEVMLKAQPEKRTRQTPVDVEAFRRQVKHAVGLINYSRHYESVWEVVSALDNQHHGAQVFLHGGDAKNALALLLVIGEEVIPHYGELEEETQIADFLYAWSNDLTEAILAARLPNAESEKLGRQLTHWADEAGDYGLDELLDAPIAACVRGWNPLPASDWEVDLTDFQLNVLQREDDTEAYLNLCLESGHHQRYAAKLVLLGRVDEAVEHALKNLTQAEDALLLGKILREKDYVDQAYQIGEQGLKLEGQKSALGAWVAVFAENRQQPDAARNAWRIVFDEYPTLQAYQEIKRLSSQDTWKETRAALMNRLEKQPGKAAFIEILIDEKEMDRAIDIWEKHHRSPTAFYEDYSLLSRLIEAAAASHPDWAVQVSLRQVHSLINQGSKYYPRAVTWLKQIKMIYEQHKRLDEWRSTIGDITTEYKRKWSLIEQIKTARLG